MNISSIKAFCWLLVLGAAAALGWYVKGFLDQRGQEPDPTTAISELLDNIAAPPIRDDRLVDYEKLKDGYVKLDWTGAPPKEVVEVEQAPETPTAPPVKPVSDLLRVVYIQVDTVFPKRSLAWVYWTDSKIEREKNKDTADIRIGDRVPAPYGDIRVEDIRPDGVVFAFDEEGREHELVRPAELELDSQILVVGKDGPLMVAPNAAGDFPTVTERYRYWPDETTEIRPGEYRVGKLDGERIGENWSEVLANEVRHSRWRNPQTGRYEGIRINDIAAGSVAGKFGIAKGDIIKSINGHPVSSSQEAIAFVKKEVKEKVIEKWYVVVEHLGADKTVVIQTPQQ